MKKIVLIPVCIVAVIAAAYAIWGFGFRKSIPETSVNEQVLSILKQNDCFVCHSRNPQLPAYSKLPVIGRIMAEHANHAVRLADLETKLADMDNVDQVTLAMLDYAMEYGTMPIHEYKMVHWGTGFNSAEKKIVSDWMRDSQAYAGPFIPVPASFPCDAGKAALGEKMFNDGRISLDGTISCATCHILEIGGADFPDERVSIGISGLTGGVNAPTVYNSVFNVRQFWNGRAADLKEQAAGPATNPVEMGDQTLEQIVARLSADKALVAEFNALYPGEGLSPDSITDAIAEFEKTLLTPDCRFDLYLKGDADALSKEELAGYEAFRKNACATCHSGVLLGGRSFEELGIFENYFADRDDVAYGPDDDGLMGFTGNPDDLHKFKTPGLRNVAITAPYYHDGTYGELGNAVKDMARYELGKDLSDGDVDLIVKFLGTLTGKSKYLTKK